MEGSLHPALMSRKDIVNSLPELYFSVAPLIPNVLGFFGSEIYRESIQQIRDSFMRSINKIGSPEDLQISGRDYEIAYRFMVCNLPGFAEVLDQYRISLNSPKVSQYAYSPHLLMFLAAAGFPNTTWDTLSDRQRAVLEKVFFFEDDGPIPAFDEPWVFDSKDREQHTQLLKRYNSTGRCLERRNIVVDWSFSDSEIIRAFTKHLKSLRHKFPEQKTPRSAGFWADVPLDSDTYHLLLQTREFVDLYRSSERVRNLFAEANTMLSRYAANANIQKRTDKKLTGISKQIMSIFPNHSQITGTKKLRSILLFICRAFNLPKRFKNSKESCYALPTRSPIKKQPQSNQL